MLNKISFQLCFVMLLAGTTLSLNGQFKKDGFIRIFDGKSFHDWECDTSFWRIEDNSFIGEVTKEKQLKTNTFLIYRGETPDNFEFKAKYRISPEGNSGVQYRSEELSNIKNALKGYQADIDGENRYTGQNYEERGRGFLAMRGQKAVLKEGQKPVITGTVGNSDSLKSVIKVGDWNDIHIIANGNHITHYINGVLMSETTDEDLKNRKLKGLIGLQVHVMPKMKVEYKKIMVKEIF